MTEAGGGRIGSDWLAMSAPLEAPTRLAATTDPMPPGVRVIDGVLSEDECAMLIARAETASFEPSKHKSKSDAGYRRGGRNVMEAPPAPTPVEAPPAPTPVEAPAVAALPALTPSGTTRRLEWHEEALFSAAASSSVDGLTDALMQNRSVIAVAAFASAAECAMLLAAGSAAESAGLHNPLTSDGTRLRIEIMGRKLSRGERLQPLDEATRALAETLIHRSIAFVQAELPALSEALGLSGCTGATRLSYSQGEPAINVYYGPGGDFKPHQDQQALTLLIPLSTGSTDFEGGGTSFWPPEAQLPEARSGKVPPAAMLRPDAGTALLWGGTFIHAGAEVTSGRRVVFVASFTPVA